VAAQAAAEKGTMTKAAEVVALQQAQAGAVAKQAAAVAQAAAEQRTLGYRVTLLQNVPRKTCNYTFSKNGSTKSACI
jgi:hypothetical protein